MVILRIDRLSCWPPFLVGLNVLDPFGRSLTLKCVSLRRFLWVLLRQGVFVGAFRGRFWFAWLACPFCSGGVGRSSGRSGPRGQLSCLTATPKNTVSHGDLKPKPQAIERYGPDLRRSCCVGLSMWGPRVPMLPLETSCTE